ncbi:MAG: C4-type zinc ribbon domain-containing protein [Deltaproteobacteria bacterium]|nr:C4-type zinc ribbon domain-containing protein [Deltaproteobacteria bacterium]
MREKLALLIELQKMESAAGRITARKKDLPVQLGELETKFMGFSAVVETQREQLEDLRKRRKEKDNQLRLGQETLKRTRERLLEVKTNKEYQSILKEIETLETKNSHMEDEIISLLEELDVFEKGVKTKEADLDVQRRRYEEDKAKMEEELNSIAKELDLCARKGGEIREKIPADMLRKYEQIKSATRGVAVVSVWKEVCGGCHMSIPPQLYNELQKSQVLITCPNCSRIIYWENRNG